MSLMAGAASALTFTEQAATDNPLDGVDVGSQAVLHLVDIDNDGDFDAFIGEFYGSVKYYRNDGSASSPAFVEQTGTDNPFDGVDVGDFSKPHLVDIELISKHLM